MWAYIIELLVAQEPKEEFVLSYCGDGTWQIAWINDRNRSVALGELGTGKFNGDGATPEEAVKDLLRVMRERQP